MASFNVGFKIFQLETKEYLFVRRLFIVSMESTRNHSNQTQSLKLEFDVRRLIKVMLGLKHITQLVFVQSQDRNERREVHIPTIPY